MIREVRSGLKPTPSDTPTEGAERDKQEVGQKNSIPSFQISDFLFFLLVHTAVALIRHTQWLAVCMELP